jgi:hypothetical protein
MTPSAKPDRPWWVDAAYKLGVPSVALAYVLWFLVTQVSASLIAIQKDVREHVASSNFYLHAICVNAAKGDREIENCKLPAAMNGGTH